MNTPIPTRDLEHVLDHTRDLWPDLRGGRIFITGGTGFFGIWLLETFGYANIRLGLGAQATILTRDPAAVMDRRPPLATNPAIRLHPGDMRTFEFPAGEFSHIVHAATQAPGPEPLAQFDANVAGTRRALDFSLACGAARFLFTSSGAVYGRQPPEMTHIPEDYPSAPSTTDPASAYGQSKRVSEFLCAACASTGGLQTLIARCFAFVGPGLPLEANFAIGNFIRDGLKGGPILVQGDGTPHRSYLYAADLAIWLWTILLRGETCRPYNVGSDEGISIAELAQRVKEVAAPGARIDVAGKPVAGKPAERYVPSIERCRSELGAGPLDDLAAERPHLGGDVAA